MFFNQTPAALKDGLDRIAVPVFAIERDGKAPFRIAALNEAYSNATGVLHADVRGMTPHDILERQADADAVVRNFEGAFSTGRAISYRETVVFGGLPLTFDTTLHPVTGDDGLEQLIGTTLLAADEASGTAELRWFLEQSETALLALADIMQHSRGGAGTGVRERTAMAMMVRSARSALDQLRAFSEGSDHVGVLLNKSAIPPETKARLH